MKLGPKVFPKLFPKQTDTHTPCQTRQQVFLTAEDDRRRRRTTGDDTLVSRQQGRRRKHDEESSTRSKSRRKTRGQVDVDHTSALFHVQARSEAWTGQNCRNHATTSGAWFWPEGGGVEKLEFRESYKSVKKIGGKILRRYDVFKMEFWDDLKPKNFYESWRLV